MRLIDSKKFTPEGMMRERHKQLLINNKYFSALYIRKDLEANYPDVDVSKYISELQAEIANEINSNIHR